MNTCFNVEICRVRWVAEMQRFALDFGDCSIYAGDQLGVQILCREILGNAPHTAGPEPQGNAPLWIYRNVRIELGHLVGKSTVIINPQ